MTFASFSGHSTHRHRYTANSGLLLNFLFIPFVAYALFESIRLNGKFENNAIIIAGVKCIFGVEYVCDIYTNCTSVLYFSGFWASKEDTHRNTIPDPSFFLSFRFGPQPINSMTIPFFFFFFPLRHSILFRDSLDIFLLVEPAFRHYIYRITFSMQTRIKSAKLAF